jgi:prepilin-type N-terminal cleavage/methylation domain-containing protein
MNKIKQRGFTLIELLIVIAIIVVLAAGAFVALDPATRFADSRNATRWTDVTAVLEAAKIEQVDLEGVNSFGPLQDGSDYMIGTDDVGCTPDACSGLTGGADDCIDLTPLQAGGYIAEIPEDPTGDRSTAQTGYYIRGTGAGVLTVGSCDAERGDTIAVTR